MKMTMVGTCLRDVKFHHLIASTDKAILSISVHPFSSENVGVGEKKKGKFVVLD